jgi:hypothetical protein
VLTKQHRQERLAWAYVEAVVASCGFSMTPRATDYGIDLSVNVIKTRGTRHVEAGRQLDIQLKSTTLARIGDAAVTHDLEVKAYEDLRDPEAEILRILVLLVLPQDEAEWVTTSEEALVLRRCAYWLSLRGEPPATTKKTTRLMIPRSSLFSVQGLQAIMERLRKGEPL